jgi:hypothetical protein
MPSQFDSFGVRFLYPDNWILAERDVEDGDQGATLDLPAGGFVSLEITPADQVDGLVDGIVRAIAADYEDLEREDISLEGLPAGTRVTDLRFYYLDLLIISRLIFLKPPNDPTGQSVLMIQAQAESRDFDKNEAVFAAILKQIVDGNA